MSKVVLGVTSDGKPFAIDLVLLLETRLLLQANSGGGKSWGIRRLIEQIFGKVQIILIDREGEFKSLRDKYDFLLIGEGGDIPAHIRSARLLAEKLLESGVSAICDLYEAFRTRPIDRLAWVREFLMGLVDAPKHLWRDVIVIVDEAHIFCPEVPPKGRDMEERDIINGCKDAVVALCTVGRKRGQTAVLATQRLAKVDKDATAELLNRMIGMTLEGQDVDRAIDLMSIARDEKAEFRKSLRELEPGNFYVFGRAISKERILVKVGDVETKHHDPRSRKHVDYSPPTPAKIRALLSKFEDLPKEIEEKARTEADLRKENAALKGRLAQLERQAKATSASPTPVRKETVVKKEVEIKVQKIAVLKDSDVASLRAIVRRMGRIAKGLTPFEGAVKALGSVATSLGAKIDLAVSGKNVRVPAPPMPVLVKSVPKPPPPLRPSARPKEPQPSDGEGALTNLQLRQLTGLSEFERIGISKVDRKWLAGWLGMSLSGHFKNEFGKLRKSGLIDYDGMKLLLTKEGRQAAPPSDMDITVKDILARCASAVSDLAARQLRQLHSDYPQWVGREDLAQALGMALSGHFKNEFGKLHRAGMIDYGTGENRLKLRCADWLFLEQLQASV